MMPLLYTTGNLKEREHLIKQYASLFHWKSKEFTTDWRELSLGSRYNRNKGNLSNTLHKY
jgi:hypothetical protein